MAQKYHLSSSSSDLWFLVRGQGQNHRVIVPRELLDDELTNAATIQEREEWAEANIEKIMKAYTAKVSGGVVMAPFDRIVVREEI